MGLADPTWLAEHYGSDGDEETAPDVLDAVIPVLLPEVLPT